MSVEEENHGHNLCLQYSSSAELDQIEDTPQRINSGLMDSYNKSIKTSYNNLDSSINLDSSMNLDSMTKSEFNLLEIKKELTDIKQKEILSQYKVKPFENIEEEISEDKKQKNVEKIIKKWLSLQKTIKEEITLEDVIIHQQDEDKKSLKQWFKTYYDIKLKTRKNFEMINELNIGNKDYLNLPSFYIQHEIEKNLKDACEPIKNLLFLLRDNYDYLLRLLSLITQNDIIENRKKINSIVELFNNQFYENILLPNPEQPELLILIYKLFEEEIIPMGSASPDDFLNNDSFLGIFLSSYSKRQEIIGYISMILNPIILSIDNEERDCLDLSFLSIKRFLISEKEKGKEKDKGKDKLKDKRRSSQGINYFPEKKNEYSKNPRALKDFLFSKIPKSKIKFKKNFELEAEKENEEDIKNTNSFCKDDCQLNESAKSLVHYKKMRRTLTEKVNLNFNSDIEYNKEYMFELNQDRLIKKIKDEKDAELKEFFIKQLENINSDSKKYSNEGILKLLDNENNPFLIELYKENFLFIRKIIDNLLQTIVDKIITLPYSLRCICKIIYLLISKKFPYLSKYSINTFLGKFLLNKCIFPVLSLRIKNVLDMRIFSQKTKKCLDIVIDVLAKANSGTLYNTYTDPEKTIFNQYLIEIIPTLNKFYEKIIDVQLPKVMNDLINETTQKMENNNSRKIFNFRHKKQIVPEQGDNSKTPDNNQMPPPLFNYFKENSDEILHLQSICFSTEDILFLTELIGRNLKKFSDLPKYKFFCKTYQRIIGENELLKNLIIEQNEQDKSTRKVYFIIFKEEINEKLANLLQKKKKDRSTFESSEQDSDLICKRIKFCIKIILKGLNLLNNKDFAYLNFAKSTDKFFSALKYTLDELGEYSELSNIIPLKWYAQYIYNYKKELSDNYQRNDFNELYEEIYTEEANILNELKSLSSIVITRDGMNLRCAEKVIEKAEYELKILEEAKKYIQIEKFIDNEKIEACITLNEDFLIKQKANIKPFPLPFFINDMKNCTHKENTNEKIPNHIYNIRDFISLFPIKFDSKDNKEKQHNRLRFSKIFQKDISLGERKYHSNKIIENYMELVKKQIKDPSNKKYFGDIKDNEVKEILGKIENYILRRVYKYIYPTTQSQTDDRFYEYTRKLEWIKPEHLEIKKLYVNQLKFAEKYIKQIDKAHTVVDKIDCINNAYVTMNNTVKFISGKNEDAGQDELTPLFQYILIKSQPEFLFTNINYIKSLLSEADLLGPKGFYVSQMESASSFIFNINYSQLKMDKDEFISKTKAALDKYYKEKLKNTNKKK